MNDKSIVTLNEVEPIKALPKKVPLDFASPNLSLGALQTVNLLLKLHLRLLSIYGLIGQLGDHNKGDQSHNRTNHRRESIEIKRKERVGNVEQRVIHPKHRGHQRKEQQANP